MKTEMEVKKEEAAFEMLGSSYDGDGELVEVSYNPEYWESAPKLVWYEFA